MRDEIVIHGESGAQPQGNMPITPPTPDDVAQAVRAIDPTVYFILPRVLRRVIKQDRQLTGIALRVPHRKSYVIHATPLLEIVDRDELIPNDNSPLPDRVILLPYPDASKLENAPADETWLYYWRLLFHAEIHAELDGQIAKGTLTSTAVRQRIQQIGIAEFDEIRLVLQQEDLLLPPQTDLACYVEFAAVYSELQHFTPSFLPRYFPSLADANRIDAVLAQDIDANALFQTTKPLPSIPIKDRCEIDQGYDDVVDSEWPEAETYDALKTPSESKCRRFMRKAQHPASLGNVVRAAIYYAQAKSFAPPDMLDQVEAAIQRDVYRLVRRLRAALKLGDSAPPPWQEAIFALVHQAPRDRWSPESRLLYDLQKVCVDHEREIYTVDVIEWAISFGRRPIKRSLPHQCDVLMSKHLRSAVKRLAVVRLSQEQRKQLASMIHNATEHVELRLRERLRPILSSVLEEVGLVPNNTPEVVAREKLVEELLDQIVESGFLTMGGLRDTISRNNLKLPDITKPTDFVKGDPLLRADRRLAVALDGVYYRGEFYLRDMQRLSSLAFGTGVGRFLTRFAAVPFGGAYVCLAGLHHLVEMVEKLRVSPPPIIENAESAFTSAPQAGFSITSPFMIGLVGLFLMGLVNSAVFRQSVASLLHGLFRIVHSTIVEPISWVIHSEWVQRFFHSRLFVTTFRFLIKPLFWTGVAWVTLPFYNPTWKTAIGHALSLFLGANLLLNSRVGRKMEELMTDWLVQTWHRVGLRILTGLFWLIVDISKRVLETIEWLMYSVDEWLRFRSGQSMAMLGYKAVLGVIWFFVAYVLRFSVNLLIEPQINPIKHFPVVTVSHKLLWPLVPSLAGLLANTMEKGWAYTVAAGIITCIPGIFGFLVWELKENWRLYAANRRKELGPTPIGSHGETMGRFLKLGFHSGTLPKRFAKLRRAERKARSHGGWNAVRKHLRVLHHVEISIQRHVEREFITLLMESPSWQRPAIALNHVRVDATSVFLEFTDRIEERPPIQLAISIQSGWLIADVHCTNWIDKLAMQEREVLATALIGLYKSMGVELVQQHIEAAFHDLKTCHPSPTGIVLWLGKEFETEVLYDLHVGPWIAPQTLQGLPYRSLPTLERSQLVFGDVSVPWDRWVTAWQQDHCGHGIPRNGLVNAQVLPQNEEGRAGEPQEGPLEGS